MTNPERPFVSDMFPLGTGGQLDRPVKRHPRGITTNFREKTNEHQIHA